MIRLLLIIIFILIFSIYTLIDIIISFILLLFKKKHAFSYYHKVIYVFTKVVLFLSGTKTKLLFKDNIEKIRTLVREHKPIFIVSNHRSNFDFIIGYSLLNIPCVIVAKDNLAKVPLVSYWMKKIDCIFLNRNDIRSGIEMVVKAINKINDGMPIWIFPEGTRNKNSDPMSILEFKAGAFKIASKTNAYICPIAFYNTDLIFEKHKPFVKSQKVGMAVLDIYKYDMLNDNNKIIVSEYTENLVKNALLKLNDKIK